MSGFVWKPQSESDGNLAVLFPANSPAPQTIYLVTSSGEVVQGTLSGRTNGNRPTYRFPGDGASYGSNITLVGPSNMVFGITNGAQRHDDGNPPTAITSEEEFNSFVNGGSNQSGGGGGSGSRGPNQGDGEGGPDRRPRGNDGRPSPNSNAGSVGNVLGGGSGGGSGNNIGTEPNFGFAFPQADFSGLNPLFIPRFTAPVVDPLERTGEVGDFNRLQSAINFRIGSDNALALTQLEFDGLQSFNRQARDLQAEGIAQENVFNQGQISLANEFNRGELPAANEFNRGQITDANIFNQTERTRQLDTAMPGARQAIDRQIERGSQLAEGRFVTDAEDRAFEVAARSASADGTVARGFGDDSVFGRRSSEMLSAEQRLGVSQIGEQTLDRFLRMGANLSFDQPIKQNPVINQPLNFEPQIARTSQDVRGAPSRPASELAVQQQFQLDGLSTIAPAQAIGFDINQNQFQANLDRQADTFNSETGLKVQLEQLYAEVFNAQQEAGAINLGISTGIAQSNFQQGIDAGQNSAIFGALGQIGGALGGAALGSFLNNRREDESSPPGSGSGGSSGGAATPPPAGNTSGGATPNTTGQSPPTTQAPPATNGGLPPPPEPVMVPPDGSPPVFEPPSQPGLGDDQSGGGFGGPGVGGSGGGGGGGGAGQRVSRITGGSGAIGNDPESAALFSRAVLNRDPAARRELNDRMSRQGASGSSAASRTSNTVQGPPGEDPFFGGDGTPHTLSYLNNLYQYQDQYQDLDDDEKVIGAGQLVAGAAALAGQLGGPAYLLANSIAEAALVASQWSDLSEADKAAYIQSKAEEFNASGSNRPGTGADGSNVNAGVGSGAGPYVEGAATAYNWDQMSDYEKVKAGIYAYTGGTAAPLVEIWEGVFDVFGVSFEALYNDAFGSNKSKDQQLRDAMRSHGEEYGLFVKPDSELAEANGLREGSHHVQLANGGYYDIGVDGTNKVQNYGTNIDGKTERNTFDVDWSDPRASETVGMINPLAYILYGKHAPKFIGHLTNAATSDNNSLSGTKNNVKHMAESIGVTYDQGLHSLKRMYDNGEINRDTYDAYLNGWSDLMLSDGVRQDIVI